MRSRALLLFFCSSAFLLSVSATALAQLPPPPPPPPGGGGGEGGGGGGGSLPPPASPPPKGNNNPPPAHHEERRRAEPRYEGPPGDVPPARTGFQVGLRTGLAIPLGNVYQGAKMSDTWGIQVPLIVDVGGKPSPYVFLGGTVGLGFGSAGGASGNDCNRRNLSCGAFRFDIGFLFQYFFIPDGSVNPWLGAGFGYELNQISVGRNNGNSVTTTSFGGFDFLRMLFGVDFRINRVVGVGPFMEFKIGQYFSGSTSGGAASASSDIPNKSVHEWFTLGVRVVFFP